MKKSLKLFSIGALIGTLVTAAAVIAISKRQALREKELKELDRLKKKYEK